MASLSHVEEDDAGVGVGLGVDELHTLWDAAANTRLAFHYGL